ncbi:hypothetical protein [Legionella sp. 16cNR16C]|uniref:hypothetical protein n=1 Tax=Legionella sp. 16cNR16C TaxID=2905656 RepID=UPI001E4E3A6A|nr:hypothetical protein [Legionella sp. 16cNR16C]MCE3046313.1 hypothetical protein [Legionella sp. 16cNR16C]
MVDTAYTNFLNQKERFFEKQLQTTTAVEEYMRHHHKNESTELEDDEYEDILNFRSIAPNKTLIEQDLYDILGSMDKKLARQQDNVEIWIWAYLCCLMLEEVYKANAYHQYYRDRDKDLKNKAELYALLRQQIKNRIEKNNVETLKARESFLAHLLKKIKEGLLDLAETPFHLSLLRNKIAYLNVCRLYWAFCRMTLSSGLRLARDTHVLEKLDKLVGHHIDAEKIIHTFELPNSIFRALSVGFFASRFMLDSLALIKHTFFPTEEEKSRTRTERFMDELYKRHCNFLNDIVWATVNGITNYNSFFHISAPAAGWITAGFLVFDVAMIMWRRFLAHREYDIKRKQYVQELADIEHHLQRKGDVDDKESRQLKARHEAVRAQLRELDLKWEAANAKFLFNAAAASLLVIGFSAALLFTPPGIILASYALCAVAVGMYLSADAFGEYREKTLRLQEAVELARQHREDPFDTLHDKDYWSDQLILDERVRKLIQEHQNARHDFIYTMIKNTVMPALIISTLAICWQAALVIIAAYAVYELVNAYQRHQQKQPALPEPEVSEEEKLLKDLREAPLDELHLETAESNTSCCF